MKVCYINPAVLLRRPIAELISRLPKDYEVGLLIPKPLGKGLDNSLHYSELPKRVRVYTYSVIQPPGASEWPIPITPMFFVQLIRIFWYYDLIHMWAHFYLVNFWASLFALFFKARLVLTMDTVPGYSFSAGKWYDFAFRFYYKSIGRLIFWAPARITLYGKSLLPHASKAGINPKKVEVIPTGIKAPEKKGDGEAIKREFGITPDERVVLFVGLLVPRKGVDTLLKVIARIKHNRPRVLIVGDGPMRQEYEKMASRLGLGKSVVFTGFRKDVFNFYAAANVFLFPSRGEGLPGVVMEAMACGVPVLASKIPCITDLIEEGKSGLLCPEGGIACFTKKLEGLLSNPELRGLLREGAREKIKGFDWEEVIKKYLHIYEDLSHSSLL